MTGEWYFFFFCFIVEKSDKKHKNISALNFN